MNCVTASSGMPRIHTIPANSSVSSPSSEPVRNLANGTFKERYKKTSCVHQTKKFLLSTMIGFVFYYGLDSLLKNNRGAQQSLLLAIITLVCFVVFAVKFDQKLKI